MRRMRRLFIALVVGACADRSNASGPNVIDVPRADKAPPIDAGTTDQDEARRLMVEGRQLVAKKAYAEAIPKFEASMKKVWNAQLLYDIGSCYEAMGEHHKAADTYEMYVAKGDLSHIDRMSMELRIKQLRVVE